MKFKHFFENTISERPITDRWPLNKDFYDMASPEGRKHYDDDLKSYFDMKKRAKPKIVAEKTISKPYEITCWRGCDLRTLERDTIKIGLDYRVMHGPRAMEGFLWFTHSLQQDDPYQFAKSYSEGVLITYPLNATKHVLEKVYDDGQVKYVMPPEMLSKVDRQSISPYLTLGNAIYEVPDGWFFTWQVQKHLGCKKPIKILNSMISIESR